jgi:hypothetical protein
MRRMVVQTARLNPDESDMIRGGIRKRTEDGRGFTRT